MRNLSHCLNKFFFDFFPKILLITARLVGKLVFYGLSCLFVSITDSRKTAQTQDYLFIMYRPMLSLLFITVTVILFYHMLFIRSGVFRLDSFSVSDVNELIDSLCIMGLRVSS